MGLHPTRGELARFSAEVRSSTLKRFKEVRAGDWGWRHRSDLLSFGDVLKHLVDADRWLFERLEGGPPSEGVVIAPGDADGMDCSAGVEELSRLGVEKVRRIEALTDEEFSTGRFDLGRRGVVDLAQLILRCNLDHEIHHRGALQMALRLRYG